MSRDSEVGTQQRRYLKGTALAMVWHLALASPEASGATPESGAAPAAAAEAIANRSYASQMQADILSRSTLTRRHRPRRADVELDPVFLERTERYNALTSHHSSLHGLETPLVQAVIYAESGGDRRARSRQGAAGLMQLMPATARQYGVTDPFDPEQSIASGARYLRELMDRFGSVELALWAYNAGPTSVERGHMPSETQEYVPRVLRLRRAFASRGVGVASHDTRRLTRY